MKKTDNYAKIVRHLKNIEKKVDFLYTELASFENMEGRIESLESQIKLLRQSGIEVKKSIEETVNIASDRVESQVSNVQDTLDVKKVVEVKPKKKRFWLFWR